MAIKSIKFKEGNLLDGGEISFTNNIVSVVGMNGSGKSILMRHIKEQWSNIEKKQVVSKKDLISLKTSLSPEFSKGKSKVVFEEYMEEVAEDGMIDALMFYHKIDNFVWDRFINASKTIFEENMDEQEFKRIMEELNSIKTKKTFEIDLIKNISNEIEPLVVFDRYKKMSDILSNYWHKSFRNSKIITVDITSSPVLYGDINQNGIGDYTLSKNLKENPLFSRLMRVAKAEKRLNSFVNSDDVWNKNDENKVNDWLASYLSQNIKISLKIYGSSYSISFYESDPDNEIEFEYLSTGTQNLFKIISQITDLNTETIVQIDEPETGMHPIMQIQFRAFLENIVQTTGARFIIYTHSIHIVKDGPNTKGLYIMSRNNGVSKIYSKNDYSKNEDIMDIQIFESIGFESLETNYNFDKNNKIVIVEGDTDVIYLKKMAKLLEEKNISFVRTKLGGASTVDKTAMLLNAVHDIDFKNIVLAPDLDIKDKLKPIYKKIKTHEYGKVVLIGNENRKEIEGLFDESDHKYVASLSGNKNTKMNKANLFWRDKISIKDLSSKTQNNFKSLFEEFNS